MQITIEALEAYLKQRYGGWGTEQGMFMKLVEEIGEVAEVLNKRAGRKASDGNDLQEELGTELADRVRELVAQQLKVADKDTIQVGTQQLEIGRAHV